MATQRQVEQTLRVLMARSGSVQDSLGDSLPESRVLTLHVTDLDAHYWTKFAAGRAGSLRRGNSKAADISIRVASDDLIELAEGRANFLLAYLTGRLRVEATPADLQALRKLIP